VDHNIPFVSSSPYYFRLILTSPRRTASRKNFSNVKSFIEEPDSRAQCQALEENVKEFGITYFGMADRRQGGRALAYSLFIVLTG
jgi:hypothetical protein